MTAGLARPLRVVHVAGSAQWAGGEVFLQQMAERLDRKRFEMRLVCPEEGPLSAEMSRRDIPCEVVPLHPLGNPRPIWKLRRLLNLWEADVVQSHGARSNFYARLAAGGRIPHISTVHNALGDYPVSPLRKGLYQALDAWSAARSRRIVCVADALRREFLERAPSLEGKTLVIHNGVDAAKYDPSRFDPEKTRAALQLKPVWTLGVIGRMTPQKGHIYLLEALRRAQAVLPTFQLLLAGDGPLRSWLEQKTVAYGLRPFCHFLGVRSDVPALLSVMDAVVLPSVSEGFPYVLLEALAMKRPVVASQVNGVSEIIPSSEEGYLVPPRQPEKLEEALRRLLQDPGEARRRAENGHRRVKDRFDVRKSVARWEALYLETASESRGGRGKR